MSLDFSAKPGVIVLNPTKKEAIKPGDGVFLQTMLCADPERGMLVMSLEDKTKVVGKYVASAAGGKVVLAPKYASLDPIVVITDASGKQLAKGKMPFG